MLKGLSVADVGQTRSI